MSDTVLNYEESGEGTPLVLLHGFPFDHSIWNAQLEAVGKEARVLAPDLPGFGRSALPDAEPTIEGYADRVAVWAAQLGIDRLVLAGHSMGGYVALAFARKYPEMLAGLGLICTRAGADTPEGREARYHQIARVWDRGPQVVVDAMLPKLFSQATRDGQPAVVEQVEQLMLTQSAPGIVGALRAMAGRPDLTPLLAEIKAATLVAGGRDDPIIPAQDVDLMAATIPGARHVWIEGAAHMPMLEKPEEMSALLIELVRGA